MWLGWHPEPTHAIESSVEDGGVAVLHERLDERHLHARVLEDDARVLGLAAQAVGRHHHRQVARVHLRHGHILGLDEDLRSRKCSCCLCIRKRQKPVSIYHSPIGQIIKFGCYKVTQKTKQVLRELVGRYLEEADEVGEHEPVEPGQLGDEGERGARRVAGVQAALVEVGGHERLGQLAVPQLQQTRRHVRVRHRRLQPPVHPHLQAVHLVDVPGHPEHNEPFFSILRSSAV